ncbi:MAG: hypothetical protein M1814_004621 [Vezdaea aestivalis]|nr:MAG: hypothetical protein M1814_004621 [Vezdaea aestivalis]
MNSNAFIGGPDLRDSLTNGDYDLNIRQGPERGRVAGVKEKDRKPVDPPPIIQLRIKDDTDPQHPYFFMCCNLYDPNHERPAQAAPQTALAGTLVSSLHRLKDVDNADGGFFVFGDLSVKIEGEFRLRFSLFEMRKAEVFHIKSIVSKPFTVYPAKSFPGMSESTFLSRSFGDQGVRLRIRKEPRTMMRKRPASQIGGTDEYANRYSNQMINPQMMQNQQNYQYMTQPDYQQQYNIPIKRARTSLDMSSTNGYMNRGAVQYDSTVYPQNGSYNPYSQNVPTQYSYAGPHSAPAVSMPDYNFSRHAHSNSTSTSSPYGSPRSQMNQRSPLGSAPSYSQQPRYAQTMPVSSLPPPQGMTVPNIMDPTPPIRTHNSITQQYSNPAPQHSLLTSNGTVASPVSSRPTHQQRDTYNPYTATSDLTGMPPPGRQQTQNGGSGAYSLPPIGQTAASPINSVAATAAPIGNVPLTLQPPHTLGAPAAYRTGEGTTPGVGPPRSFDSAAQQTNQTTTTI